MVSGVLSGRRGRGCRASFVVLLVSALVATVAVGCGSGSSSPAAADDLVLPLIVGLRRDDARLAEEALRRSTPSDPDYLEWLTPEQVVAGFGAPAERVSSVLATLQGAGFTGAADPTAGLLVGSMRAADAAKFFGTRVVQVPLGTSGSLAMPERALKVPKKLAGDVSEVIGLTMLLDADTTGPVPAPGATPPADPACPPSKGLGGRLHSHYGLDPLLEAGSTGKGVRMAMVEVSPTSQKALQLMAACRPFRVAPVTVVGADASSPEAFASKATESTLDVAAASLMAPGLDGIDVFQVNPYAPVAVGLAAALTRAGSEPAGSVPQVVSLSLGFCEPQVTDAEIAVAERLLMGAALMGTTVIASSGDFGSSACAPDDLAESVQYPASSPWVLGVGGTTLVSKAGEITGEVVWGANGFGGGGGRTSRVPRPSWQADIPVEGKRIVPDVAFLANPADLGAIPTCDLADRCTWEVNGGTSATAPGVAGGLAVIMQSLAGPDGRPRRLGALNPALYAMERAGKSLAGTHFIDIVSGSNDVRGIGCCTAAPGYDPASGWGVVDFGVAAQRFAAVISRKAASG